MIVVASVTPFLMFEGQAEAAMRFYVEVLPDTEITRLDRYGPDGPGAEGQVLHGAFRVAGRQFRCMDSPVRHRFSFTPSLSLFVECRDRAELERLYAALSEGGEVLMEIGEYGFSQRFGWVNDRFGVSWQLNLP